MQLRILLLVLVLAAEHAGPVQDRPVHGRVPSGSRVSPRTVPLLKALGRGWSVPAEPPKKEVEFIAPARKLPVAPRALEGSGYQRDLSQPSRLEVAVPLILHSFDGIPQTGSILPDPVKARVSACLPHPPPPTDYFVLGVARDYQTGYYLKYTLFLCVLLGYR